MFFQNYTPVYRLIGISAYLVEEGKPNYKLESYVIYLTKKAKIYHDAIR